MKIFSMTKAFKKWFIQIKMWSHCDQASVLIARLLLRITKKQIPNLIYHTYHINEMRVFTHVTISFMYLSNKIGLQILKYIV